MKGVGIKIKKIRELRNFTPQYVADKLGESELTYTSYENPSKDISPEKLKEIADILEVSTEQIEQFGETQFFNNHTENVNDSGVNNNNGIVMGAVNNYSTDPRIFQLYESQIHSLKKQIQLLEEKIAMLERR